jgi:hypothetical protein
MKSTFRLKLLLAAGLLISRAGFAETDVIGSELADAYYFVDTYEVMIDAASDEVWPHLVDVASWMYEFSMIHESGPRNAEGEVLRLYEGQDYLVQLAKLIPGKLMVAVNLPSLAEGEQLVGISMFTLTEVDGKTLVSNFMTRHSVWVLDTPNTLREVRESAEFQQSTRDRWNRFLTRLRELAEGTYTTQESAAHPVAPPLEWTTAEDHQDMQRQLGITAPRPGPSGREGAPNPANYDESAANRFPEWPDLLTLDDGTPVASASAWWNRRRPEIVADFEREVVGRIPAGVPDVQWSVAETATGTIGGRAVIGKRLVGLVDNSNYPMIEVDIDSTLVVPADAEGPVPIMIMFRGGTLQQAVGNAETRAFGPPGAQGGDPPATEQLISAGWGYAFLNPTSIQADNGAGLTRGIIGLVNEGQARKPDDWGSLRAWSWGAARVLDYLEADPAVDAARIGIEGVSRYGKAALVTMAFEPRFAVGLIGSSGEGGISPYRRDFGETVENLTGSGEYHWMAGNFLKYGTAESSFGSMNAGDLPVDSHLLLALTAPRATFISYGVPEQGDALWLDQQGSYMATVAAGDVFRLLGVRDLGTNEDYRTATMPAVNEGLLGGMLAWRQHDGGHTDGPNWKYFIPWAERQLRLE